MGLGSGSAEKSGGVEKIIEGGGISLGTGVGVNAEIHVKGRSFHAMQDDGSTPNKHDIELSGDCVRNVADYL